MSKNRIIIVDDDKDFAEKLAKALEGLFRIELCNSEVGFRNRFRLGMYDLIIMDMRLEISREGLDLLKEVLLQDPMQAAIVMTAYADTETYADALESGALTYLDKREFSPALIARTVEAIIRQASLKKQMAALEQRLEIVEPIEIIGISPGIRQTREAIQRTITNGHSPAVILGEAGTEKALLARNIHRLNKRYSDGPFVHAACDRLSPEQTLQSLFGVYQVLGKMRSNETKGWIDEAKGGLLLIDGIRSFSASTKEQLLRFFESGVFSRVGGGPEIEADLQIVISITEDIHKRNRLEPFLSILVDKFGGTEIRVPALRERIEDLALLAQYILQSMYRKGQTLVRSIRGSALSNLESLQWPGNVRELKSAIEFAAIRADAENAKEIGAEHLPQTVSESPLYPIDTPTAFDYQLNLARAELSLVEKAIEQFETTKVLDLAKKLRYNNRFTFSRRIRRRLEAYPALASDFPKIFNLFSVEKGKQ